MKFVHIPSTEVKRVWGDIESYIEESCKHCEDTADLMKEMLLNCISSLLTLIHEDDGQLVGALITEIHEDALHVRQLSVDSESAWIDEFMEVCADITKQLGFTKFTAEGRKGWERKLKKHGVVKVKGLYIKEVI